MALPGMSKQQIQGHLSALADEARGVAARLAVAKEEKDEGGVKRYTRRGEEIAAQVAIYEKAVGKAPSMPDYAAPAEAEE